MNNPSRELRLVRKAVLEAREQSYFYPRGRGELKFNDNTSPFGPSPAVSELMERSVSDIIGGLAESGFYPDQNAGELRGAIAGVEGVDSECVVVGAGADELLDMLFRVFVDPGSTVTVPVPAYFMYEHFALLYSARVSAPFMGRPPSLPVPADDGSRMYMVSNPHNPTGALFPAESFVRILESYDGMVVVDEAYAEYSGFTLVPLIERHPNLVVVRTFSKIHGLPNFRIGYSITSRPIALQLRKVKNPFNVTTVSQKLAEAAVRDRAYIGGIRDRVASERARMRVSLAAMGLQVFDSSANFLLVDAGPGCDALADALAGRGVFMKRVTDRGYENCLRITVRSPGENTEMLSRLSGVMRDLR